MDEKELIKNVKNIAEMGRKLVVDLSKILIVNKEQFAEALRTFDEKIDKIVEC